MERGGQPAYNRGMKYAEIMPFIPVKSGAEPPIFTYHIPDQLVGSLKSGQIVQIPVRNRRVKGLVTAIHEKRPNFATRPVEKLLLGQTMLNRHQLALAERISRYYLVPLTSAISAMLPPIRKITTLKTYELAKPNPTGLTDKQQTIVERLTTKSLTASDIKKLHLSPSALKNLIRDGIITETEQIVYRQSRYQSNHRPTPAPHLNKAQTEALTKIRASQKPALLFGVTGSGKTEVYMKLVEEMLAQNKSSIILVPEISLTPQTVNRFAERFGEQNIAVIHSHITGGVKFDEWQQIANNNKKIIIGARSALFAPVNNLGLIVIDEEHDASYKQDSNPRYHAVWAAEQLASLHQAKLVLGSATPSIEHFYKTQINDWELVQLKHSIFKAKRKKLIQLVDMSNEARAGHESIFSELMLLALSQTLAHKQQALLFLNRRGSRTLIVCRDCGKTVNCPECDIPLIYHRENKDRSHTLECHHCSYHQSAILQCPYCKSPQLKYLGLGTEQVANELTKHFPKARVLRFDKDTINSTADYIEAYEKIVQGKVDFIVGTQMIAKGWDIPKLTLVGLVLADNGFNFPDYHTYERMFSLIVQVIGRSGRREEDSRAIIQTYNSENPVTLDAINQDYEHFARQELISRKNLGWPPFAQVIRLIKTGKDLKQLQLTTGRKVEELRKTLPLASINSGSCFFAKLNGEYRYQIVMRGEKLNQKLTKTNLSGWTVDVDPVNML